MWFRFPDGTEQISVEQQNFSVQAEDENGKYFQVPDHFAPIILNLGNFSRVERPENAPPDLPQEDTSKPNPMDQLAADLDAQREENHRLREENDQLRTSNLDIQKKLEEHLKEHHEEKKADRPSVAGPQFNEDKKPIPPLQPSVKK